MSQRWPSRRPPASIPLPQRSTFRHVSMNKTSLKELWSPLMKLQWYSGTKSLENNCTKREGRTVLFCLFQASLTLHWKGILKPGSVTFIGIGRAGRVTTSPVLGGTPQRMYFDFTSPRHWQSRDTDGWLGTRKKNQELSVPAPTGGDQFPVTYYADNPRNFHHWDQWPAQLLWMPCRFHLFLPHRYLCLLMPAAWVPAHSLPSHPPLKPKDPYWQPAQFSAAEQVQENSLGRHS